MNECAYEKARLSGVCEVLLFGELKDQVLYDLRLGHASRNLLVELKQGDLRTGKSAKNLLPV